MCGRVGLRLGESELAVIGWLAVHQSIVTSRDVGIHLELKIDTNKGEFTSKSELELSFPPELSSYYCARIQTETSCPHKS